MFMFGTVLVSLQYLLLWNAGFDGKNWIQFWCQYASCRYSLISRIFNLIFCAIQIRTKKRIYRNFSSRMCSRSLLPDPSHKRQLGIPKYNDLNRSFMLCIRLLIFRLTADVIIPDINNRNRLWNC